MSAVGRHLEYVTAPGERWDHVARRHYGDASAFRPIVDANRDIFPPLQPLPPVLPTGTKLRVPILDAAPRVAAADLPPWLR